MAKIFSPEQQSAIDTRDRTLLVSAAAGSGKTTTLTERIIRSLLDEEHPESLQNMLIVTFTNASVADLNRKIGDAVKGAIRENPGNKRLERELYLLPGARICTIDSFCNEIVRSNADRAGVSPGYRLAENAEIKILSASVLDSLICAAFEGDIPEVCTADDFEELCDSLTDSKTTQKLAEVFTKLYDKSKSTIEGVDLFVDFANKYLQNDKFAVEDTVYGRDLMKIASDALKFHAGTLKAISEQLMSEITEPETDADKSLADAEVHRKNAALLLGVSNIKSYTGMREALQSLTFCDMPRCGMDAKSEMMIVGRDEMTKIKTAVKKLYTDFFVYTAEEWHALFDRLYTLIMRLARFLQKFDAVYTAEKARRGILEHSDVARCAYRCLIDENGRATDIAEAYKKRFTSIYIDEYQDVNALQDAIFSVIASNNRFMVGDIKQSIYTFRSAKPEIFAHMKTTFPRLNEGDTKDGASIFMSQNFRCDEGIIDFVNDVFTPMFTLVKDSIGYTDDDALKFSKVYPDGNIPPYTPATVYAVKRGKDDDGEEISLGARFTAERIKELLTHGTLANGKPISPSDIAILLRKRSGIEDFASELRRLGIPYQSRDTGGYFMNAEVLLTLCLLNAIDNPSKDIYLAGLMCSPLFGFTADDLLKYRIFAPKGTLYRAICAYSEENPDDARLKDFITRLSHYRCLSEGMSVDALIYRLYHETGLLALASRHGGKDNLMLLYNYARKFEGSSFEGLYNFINYINNVAERDEALDDGSSFDDSGEAVKILTVHSSKGLEYPIVFFAEASRRITNLDVKDTIAYADGYGISFYLRAPGGIALARNPVQHVIHEKMNERFFEEELRVLYVALTRAKERLFVVGDMTEDTPEEFRKKYELRSRALTAYGLRKLPSFLDIIMCAKTRAVLEFVDTDEDIREEKNEIAAEKQEKRGEGCDGEEIYRELTERFNYSYPDIDKTRLPEKLSVSRLYPTVLDGSDEGVYIPDPTDENRRVPLPAFITGTHGDESARRGIATHTVLQFCDFDRLTDKGARAELERLSDGGFISEENRARVRLREIELFARSELMREIKAAKRIWRELRFNCRLPAGIFTGEDIKKESLSDMQMLVQGVIDCLIEDNDGELHLVDYKTDRLSPDEMSDERLAAEKLDKKHSLQLGYYALAVEKIFGKMPKTVRVYSMPLGKCIDIKK